MGAIIRGYLVLTACGWAAFPFVHLALARLPDGGYAACRAFGLLASAAIAGLIVQITGAPLRTPGALAAILLVALVSFGARRVLGPASREASLAGARNLVGFLRSRGRAILAIEALFICGLLLFAWIERRNPAVDPDSERFMDYAFLKATLRSPGILVADPWFAGEPIDYYHFGYAVAAFLVRASGLSAGRFFTSAISMLYALVWAGAFGLGLALTGRRIGGAAAAFLVLGAGNLEWIRQWAERGGLGGFDWFRASRVIEGAISEFPWFSLLWGDLHPYVVALPLFACGLAFVVAESLDQAPAPGGMRLARAAGFAAASGALLATHSWDFPGLVLVACAVVLVSGGPRRGRRALLAVLAASAGALLFMPFLRGVRQSGRSLGLVSSRSHPADLAMAFGPFALLGLLVAAAHLARRRSSANGAREPQDAPGGRVAAAFAGCALLAIAACECVYLRDFFGGTALFRMNTVFKVHRIAWLLLGVASPVAILRLTGRRREPAGGDGRGGLGGATRARLSRLPVRGALALVLASAAVYPIVGTASWLRARDLARRAREAAGSRAESPEADSEALFRTLYPGDAAAADIVAARSRPGDIVLEESGDAYSWSARVATFSGVPTLLGWGNHEAGWRDDWGPVLERRAEIETIYGDPDSDRARDLLSRRHVRWVVLGERERHHYGGEGPERFSRLGRKVLDRQGCALYDLEE